MFTAKCDGLTYLVHRGNLTRPFAESENMKSFHPEEIPWDDLEPAEMRSVVQRYLKERQCGRFGIYVSDETGGRVGVLEGNPLP